MGESDSGIPFEDEIRKLLHDMDFCDVPGFGPNRETFNLGGQEIDAFGRIDDLYVVIDARTARSVRGSSDGIQSRLEAINGYKQLVIDDI